MELVVNTRHLLHYQSSLNSTIAIHFLIRLAYKIALPIVANFSIDFCMVKSPAVPEGYIFKPEFLLQLAKCMV